MSDTRRLLLLGSTGSIGTQTLDVVSHLNALHARGEWPTRFEVVGLAAGSNGTLLAEQAAAFGVSETALAHPGDGALPSALARARTGVDGAERLVREVEADVVLAAMVGSAGLPATLAAVELGRDVALANKETLVAAGELVVPAAERSGSRLLPVDSEHAALWQCLQSGQESSHVCPPMRVDRGVRRLILTASGGPFRTWEKARLQGATPAEALNHPTWRMGPKVTIDSASLTNKALEVIEAHWLFGVPGDRIDVLVHPQSTVHSFVEFEDGNVIAQLGPPDMRMPIQYAITFPLRPLGRSASLDFAAMSRLDFETPDLERFPALARAYDVMSQGGTAGAIFNAANEAAVEAFLASEHGGGDPMPFGQIGTLVGEAMAAIPSRPLTSLDDALGADREAREFVRARLGSSARVSVSPASRGAGSVG